MDSGYTLGFFRTQEESVSPSQYQFGIVDIEYNEGVHGIQQKISVQLNHDDMWNLTDICLLSLHAKCVTCDVGITVSISSWDPGTSGDTVQVEEKTH